MHLSAGPVPDAGAAPPRLWQERDTIGLIELNQCLKGAALNSAALALSVADFNLPKHFNLEQSGFGYARQFVDLQGGQAASDPRAPQHEPIVNHALVASMGVDATQLV